MSFYKLLKARNRERQNKSNGVRGSKLRDNFFSSISKVSNLQSNISSCSVVNVTRVIRVLVYFYLSSLCCMAVIDEHCGPVYVGLYIAFWVGTVVRDLPSHVQS